MVFLRCEISDFEGTRCGNVAVWYEPVSKARTCNAHRRERSVAIGAPASKAAAIGALVDAVAASDVSRENEGHKP